MKDIVLGGIQASGKDTQAEYLKEKGYEVFGMGNALRARADVGDDRGKEIAAILQTGDLVDDSVILEVLEHWLETRNSSIPVAFVGFPRSMEQYDLFKDLMERTGREYVGVLIKITVEEAMRRMQSRRVCPVCGKNYSSDVTHCPDDGAELVTRSDDADTAAIKKRLDVYFERTVHVFDAIEKEGHLLEIDGARPVEEVRDDMFAQLEI